ncbi:MAG TPA: DUF433 domain-containing protein [Chloroflexia bacterium]|nr:DUF433 domain-containing protein [Chloroflexia bacterium]
MDPTTTAPLVPATLAVPLRADEHGTIRVGDSRLTLETVLWTYLDGTPPETLAADCFPELALADAYAIVAFYLQHRTRVDAYLRGQAQRAAQAPGRAAGAHGAEGSGTAPPPAP